MPEVKVPIGGKEFSVACADGEEEFLRNAASMLDREASDLVTNMGRMPSERMLLMAGLMLADRIAAFEERANVAEARLKQQDRLIEEMKSLPPPEPQRVEVPVIPDAVTDTLAELAARAEALAALAEEKAGA